MNPKTLAMALGASQMGFMVATGLFAGLWVDRKLETMPLFGLLGVVIGFASGIFFLVRLIKGVKSDGS
jgi:F0F1-type ATP synthase assembly protein I